VLKLEKAKESEINISQDILDELMRALEQLESSTDLEGTAIVSKTGLRIVSSETSDVADIIWDIYSASPATLISLGEKISKGLEQGELRDVDVELFSHYLWSVVHGGTVVARNYAADHSEDFNAARERFHEFLITQITNQLRYFYKKIDFS